MAYTSFGEFMRILRIKHHEIMADSAKFLGVKSSFLSAVENGKKNVPTDWIDKIVSHYNLSNSEKNDLIKSIEESKTSYKISTKDSGRLQRAAAMQFARSFEELDDETAFEILKLLSKKGDQ